MFDYTNFYYEYIIGRYPASDLDFKITKNTIQYLVDCKYSMPEIITILECTKNDGIVSPKTLPDITWSKLIERDKLYFHHALHIRPTIASMNILTGETEDIFNYLEINSNVDIGFIMDYAKRRIDILEPDQNTIRGALQFMIDKYEQYPNINGVDAVLSLIDLYNDSNLYNMMSLRNNEEYALECLGDAYANAKYNGFKIIWRCEKYGVI